MTTDTYAFGYTQSELDRLRLQARLLRPMTERLLRWAGIRPGIHVLDVGCGADDVAMLAAGMVGASPWRCDRVPRTRLLPARQFVRPRDSLWERAIEWSRQAIAAAGLPAPQIRGEFLTGVARTARSTST